MVYAFLIQGVACPHNQVLFPIFRIYGPLSSNQLKYHNTKAICIALLIHSKRVCIFCRRKDSCQLGSNENAIIDVEAYIIASNKRYKAKYNTPFDVKDI